jgi:osmotically-inducible protein OsmY
MVLILIGLSGCATLEKCGVEGCAGDNEITANVHAAFAQHPELGEPNSINVQTVNPVVYLSDGVSAGEMRATAESVTRQVKGVAGRGHNLRDEVTLAGQLPISRESRA